MDIIKKTLSVLAITGNVLFILWILYNGINEGFSGTLPEKISYVTLMALLLTNSILLLVNLKKKKE